MIDLNGTTRAKNGIIDLIDSVMVARQRREPGRNYLGASLLGDECQRALQFHYFNVPADEGKGFTGRTYRIFERGNWAERYMIDLLRLAGFDIRTRDRNGKQFEFSILEGKIKGHCDGVLVAGPNLIQYPAIWENKCIGDKYFKQLEKEQLKKYSPTYYGQVQLYMTYLELSDNPALFTAVNANDMDIYTEIIPYDSETAQRVSDSAVQIIKACEAGELLPRISTDPSYFKCKWCNWTKRCLENS